MEVNPGYIAEQTLIAIGAVMALTAVLLQFFIAWKLPENEGKVQILHKIGLASLLVFGILELIWSVDPRGVWGLYSAFGISILRDWTILALLQAALLWGDLVIRSVSSFIKLVRLYDKIPVWLTSTVPIGALVILSVILTNEAVRTDNFLYRITYTFTSSSFICVFAVYAVSCLLFIRNTLKSARVSSDYTTAVFSDKFKKLFQTGLILSILSIVGFTFAVINFNSMRQGATFTSGQLPQNRSVYEPFTFYFVHIFAALGVFYIVWLPLKPQSTKTAPPSPSKVSKNLVSQNL
jgi:hypothetical protein